jgi:hypothetical protein
VFRDSAEHASSSAGYTFVMAKRKVSKPGHETIAQERDRRESEDVLRDLQASLAGDKGATTRAQHLRELRDMPRKPLHPLDIYLQERGVSRTRAATMLGTTEKILTWIIREWKRPTDAEFLAKALGFKDVGEIFPTRDE